MSNPNDVKAKTPGTAPTADDFAALKGQVETLMGQLVAAGVKSAAPYTPPPKHPTGKAKWEVFVAHSPIPPGLKRLEIEADGPEAAWQAYLAAVDEKLTHNRMNAELRMETNTDLTPQQRFGWVKDQVNAAKAFIKVCKLGKPEIVLTERGSDVIESMKVISVPTKDGVIAVNGSLVGAAYAAARRDAMVVKGTVTREQIGFPELATAH